MKKLKYIKPINEDGVDHDQAPDTYLAARKRAADTDREYRTKLEEVRSGFKTLRWQDIAWKTNGRQEHPFMPEDLRTKIKQLYRINRTKAANDIGSWAMDDNPSNEIYMKVDSSDHRSHFPNQGIPTGLRGLKLGYKLYRSLLQKYKYLKSNTAGTTEKDNVWQSLVSAKRDAQGNYTEDDVHGIVGVDNVFAMIKSLPDSEKISRATSFIENSINKSGITPRNFIIDPELKAILPKDLLAELDPAQRVDRTARTREQRYAKYAPGGVDDHSWEIGDLITVREYLVRVDYEDLPVRMVVHKSPSGEYYAVKVEDLQRYKESGTVSDPRTTDNKRLWVKSVMTALTPSQRTLVTNYVQSPRTPLQTTPEREPAAPAPAATPAAGLGLDIIDNVLSGQQRRVIKAQIRNITHPWQIAGNEIPEIYVPAAYFEADARNRRRTSQRTSTACYFVVADPRTEGQFTMVHSRTAEYSRVNQAQLTALNLVKISITAIRSKTEVNANDYVFVTDHSTKLGLLCPVSYTTRGGVGTAREGEESVYLHVKAHARTVEMRPGVMMKVTRIQ